MSPPTLHVEPDQPAGLGLEEGAVVVPMDEMRPDQRRQQRQDQCDRKAQKRRLHDGSSAGLRAPLRSAGPSRTKTYQAICEDRRGPIPADACALPLASVWRRIYVRQA